MSKGLKRSIVITIALAIITVAITAGISVTYLVRWISLASSVKKPPTQSFTWDFSGPPDALCKKRPTYDISHVGWPASNHSNVWHMHGSFDLTFKCRTLMGLGWGVYFDRYFHKTVQTFIVVREGNAIVHWVIHFDEGYPVEEGYNDVREVLLKWSGGMDERPSNGARYLTLDAWFKGVKAGENVDGQYTVGGRYGGRIMITVFGDPKDGLKRTCALTLMP